MKKVTSLLAFVLALMMLLVACGGNKPAETTGTTGTTASTTTSNTTGTTQKPADPTGCTHTYTIKVITQVTTTTEGKIEKTCTQCGDKVEETLPAVTSLKVLAIGNSFSVDAMEHLAVVAKAAGIEEIILGNMYIGGCSIDTHVGNANTGASTYTYYKNTGDGWEESKNESLDAGILDEDWDIITVQQVSQDSGRPATFSTLNRLLDYIDENKTNEDAKVYWHMTWAYQANSTHTGFANYSSNQETMYNAIVGAVKSEILGNERITGFIPSGTAIQNLRTSYLGDTLTRDGYHMSYGIGRYAAALMWLKQLTGLDINGIDRIPGEYPDIIEHLEPIKEAVNAAYANPFGVTKSTKTEYVNELLNMTDEDKAYLASLGKDPSKYEVLDLGFKFSSYWDSTKTGTAPNASASNSGNFITTDVFSVFELPIGSVIKIADGYQYRPEGWTKLNTAHSGDTRPANTTEDAIVDASWYETFNFRAFNISRLDGAEVVYEDRLAFRVYVPIVEKATESKELTDDDKAYLTELGLDPANFEKVVLDYIPFGYYNSTSATTSNVLCLANGNIANNLHSFLATRLIQKSEIPTGSIIRVDDGYQYRPERFVTLGTKPAARGANTTDKYVYVNDAWWNGHNYVGFNVAVKGNSATVSMETGTHFVIYALKAGATPVNPSGEPDPEPEAKPTTVEGWFEYHKLNMSNYELLEFTPVVSAYYYSNTSNKTNLVTTESNSPNFWATKEFFTKDTLPVGSLIFIDEGYQYRPEGWQAMDTQNTAARPANVQEACFIVTEDWWKDYTYRSFNVSAITARAMTSADTSVLKIYVPKSTADIDKDLFAGNNLDINNYKQVELTKSLKTFYNSTGGSGTTTSSSNGDTGSKFWCTQIFEKANLPVGTVIIVDEGYQYRPEGWVTLSTKNSTANRPAESSKGFFVVTEDWWGSFAYRAFNVSTNQSAISDRAVVTDADLGALRIYVPKS
ncbi:MAG: DUF4886 domain-containing protein [Clostridia bacterium]|nr:DUF4886 domain-containing protein [Clostridia bacterium]